MALTSGEVVAIIENVLMDTDEHMEDWICLAADNVYEALKDRGLIE